MPTKNKKSKPKNRGGRPRSKPIALPIYPTLGSCSAATGIPLAILKRAKREGCEAFKWSRVDLGLLLRWFFTREFDTDWADRFKKVKTLREEIALERDRKEVVDRVLVVMWIGRFMGAMFGLLHRVFCIELPAACRGCDELAIREAAEKAIKKTKTEIEKITKEVNV